MSKERTNVSIDSDLHKQAREERINMSAATEAGIRAATNTPTYFFINTNNDRLPDGVDGTKVYDHGVAVTFGPGEYGRKLDNIDVGDVILSYVSGWGTCAVGQCVAPWDGRGVVEDTDTVELVTERVVGDPDGVVKKADTRGTTLAETPKVAGDNPVEIVDGTRLFTARNGPEYLLPVHWTAVLDVEDAITAEDMRTLEIAHPQQTVSKIKQGNPELLAELVTGRAARQSQ